MELIWASRAQGARATSLKDEYFEEDGVPITELKVPFTLQTKRVSQSKSISTG